MLACLLCACLGRGLFRGPTLGLAIWVLGLAVDAAEDSPVDEESGPTEPISPSLPDDLTAPTPRSDLDILAPGRALIQPSPDAYAHTAAPGWDSSSRAVTDFPTASIPALQQRIICALSNIPDEGAPWRVLPARRMSGAYTQSFNSQAQCQLISNVQGSATAFLQALGDIAQRRGWQPIVAVQPQPDAAAIHLIPSAASPDLAAVVLQGDSGLQPTCIPRGFPNSDLGRVHLPGRRGQIQAPYPTARRFRLPVQVRDGDCLRVNTGPFGSAAA